MAKKMLEMKALCRKSCPTRSPRRAHQRRDRSRFTPAARRRTASASSRRPCRLKCALRPTRGRSASGTRTSAVAAAGAAPRTKALAFHLLAVLLLRRHHRFRRTVPGEAQLASGGARFSPRARAPPRERAAVRRGAADWGRGASDFARGGGRPRGIVAPVDERPSCAALVTMTRCRRASRFWRPAPIPRGRSPAGGRACRPAPRSCS